MYVCSQAWQKHNDASTMPKKRSSNSFFEPPSNKTLGKRVMTHCSTRGIRRCSATTRLSMSVFDLLGTENNSGSAIMRFNKPPAQRGPKVEFIIRNLEAKYPQLRHEMLGPLGGSFLRGFLSWGQVFATSSAISHR